MEFLPSQTFNRKDVITLYCDKNLDCPVLLKRKVLLIFMFVHQDLLNMIYKCTKGTLHPKVVEGNIRRNFKIHHIYH